MCCNLKLMQIAILLVSCLLIYYGFDGLRNGEVKIEGTYKGKRTVNREENPFSFWLQVSIYFIVGFGGLGFALFLQLR